MLPHFLELAHQSQLVQRPLLSSLKATNHSLKAEVPQSPKKHKKRIARLRSKISKFPYEVIRKSWAKRKKGENNNRKKIFLKQVMQIEGPETQMRSLC